MTEKWRDVVGFEGHYEVSNLGQVRSTARWRRYTHWRSGEELQRYTPSRPTAMQEINSGYLIVHLYIRDDRTAKLVHRVVMDAFVGPSPVEGYDIDHKNGNKKDNRARNLEWVSRSDNHKRAVALGLKLSAKPVMDPSTGIRYPSIAEAAKQTKHSHRTIRDAFIPSPWVS